MSTSIVARQLLWAALSPRDTLMHVDDVYFDINALTIVPSVLRVGCCGCRNFCGPLMHAHA